MAGGFEGEAVIEGAGDLEALGVGLEEANFAGDESGSSNREEKKREMKKKER